MQTHRLSSGNHPIRGRLDHGNDHCRSIPWTLLFHEDSALRDGETSTPVVFRVATRQKRVPQVVDEIHVAC